MSKTFNPPWSWEYHPDAPHEPIALVSNDGDVLLATGDESRAWLEIGEEHQRMLVAAPELLAALEDVPLPSVNESPSEFYGRFYTWYHGKRANAVARATNTSEGGDDTP